MSEQTMMALPNELMNELILTAGKLPYNEVFNLIDSCKSSLVIATQQVQTDHIPDPGMEAQQKRNGVDANVDT